MVTVLFAIRRIMTAKSFRPLIDGADRRHPGGPHHRRSHVRRGVESVDRDTGTFAFLSEVDGEEDLGKPALTIGACSRVAASQPDVRKVDRLLPERRHVH